MLKITLYKNCVLNEKYQEVFSLGIKTGTEKTVLENYLDTLTKKEIICDNVYYENEGELVFDNEIINENMIENIYSFNYLKMILLDENEKKIWQRYCFIDKINIKNGCVYINYKEDIWSSYIDKVSFVSPSYLARSRVKNYRNFDIGIKNLPFEYDGNNKLLYERVISGSNGVQIVLEIQEYELETQGEYKKPRVSFYAMYIDNNSSAGIDIPTGRPYIFDYDIAMNRIVYKIIPAVSKSALQFRPFYNPSQIVEENKFVVGKIYLIPESFNLYPKFSESDGIAGLNIIKYISQQPINIDGALCEFGKINTETEVISGEITNDYKNLLFGFLSSNIKLINNGTSISYRVFMIQDRFSFHLYLNILNEIIEITDNFLAEVPFSILTSEELSQQKIALQLKNLNYDNKVQLLQYDIVGNFFKTIVGAGMMEGGSYVKGALTEIGGMKGFFSGIENTIKLRKEQDMINVPVYSQNKGTFTNISNKFNSVNGLMLFKINSENDEFVKECINNFGYTVYEFINNDKFVQLDINGYDYFKNLNINYNVIRFAIINLTGSFPREIALKLNEILNNGIKIWYDETMSEDNYVV